MRWPRRIDYESADIMDDDAMEAVDREEAHLQQLAEECEIDGDGDCPRMGSEDCDFHCPLNPDVRARRG